LNVKQDRRLRARAKVGLLVGTAFLAFAIIAPSTMFATRFGPGSPHFIGTPTITKNPNFSLTSSFKAAGLANEVSAAFLASSGGAAVLQCVSPGGNNPPPKQVSFGPLQGQATFVTPNNGQITAIVSIGPPPLPSASQICPNPNWSVVILRLTYDNVVLHIQQQGSDALTFNFGTVDP
jgi:hypothetical protein